MLSDWYFLRDKRSGIVTQTHRHTDGHSDIVSTNLGSGPVNIRKFNGSPKMI